MGGYKGGAFASNLAIKTLKKSPTLPFKNIFEKISEQIEIYSKERPEFSEMGTTLSILRLEKNKAKVGHVGDTRLYHLRNKGILKRTEDQTEVQELINQGVLTKYRAKTYPRKNILLSVLNKKNDHKLFETSFEIQRGDRLILLSDGVHSLLTMRGFRDLSLESQGIESFKEAVLKKIETQKPKDDYSAVFIEIN